VHRLTSEPLSFWLCSYGVSQNWTYQWQFAIISQLIAFYDAYDIYVSKIWLSFAD
jgi:hypothetical protein